MVGQESSWTYENNQLEIQGPYSISLNISDLDSISLLESLPVITIRHGISTGKVAKGKFKGPNKMRYHLLIDKPVGGLALYLMGKCPY